MLIDGIRLWILGSLPPPPSPPVACCVRGILPFMKKVGDPVRSSLSTLPREENVDRALDNLRGEPGFVSSGNKRTTSSSYKNK